MKTIYLILLVLCVHVSFSQTFDAEVGIGYTYMAPINTMKQNIKGGNGITLDLYLTPSNFKRLAYGMDFNYTIYGQDKSSQLYSFEDGSQAPMDIIVNNSFTNFLVGARYYVFNPEGKKVNPYINLKAGYGWYKTMLNIYDPDDADHCEPVEKDLLYKDGTFTMSGGAGLHWDLSSIFKRMSSNRLFFNISANLTLGGKIKYMNTDAPDHNHNPGNVDTNVMADFVNTQTQVVHKHHVGNVYSSYAEMVDIRGGFFYRIPY